MLSKLFEVLTGSSSSIPRYGVEDLSFHRNEYEKHVESAVQWLDRVLLDERWTLMMKDPNGDVFPSELMGKVRWIYLPIITGWMDKEFIPKARRFTPPNKTATMSSSVDRRAILVDECDDNQLRIGKKHVTSAYSHGTKMIEVLNYLMCDTSSPVQWSKSLDGETSAIIITRWYAEASNIVTRNVERINNSLNEFVEFAEREIRKQGGMI